MTILIAVAVKPGDGLQPYLLMGSDSLKLEADSELNIKSRNDNAQKIFKINKKLISVAGRTDSIFIELLLEFIEKNDGEITSLTKKVSRFIKKYLIQIDPFEESKCSVYIGECEAGNPKLAHIEMRKADLPKYKSKIMELPQINSFVAGVAGSIKVPDDDDLYDAFVVKVGNCVNLNFGCVKRAAKEYLERAAARYPKTCNQNIQIETLR